MLSFQSLSQERRIIKKHEIRDGISPKSVVSSGNGLFSAQNMMYRHTITVYDKYGNRRAKIKDAVDLKDYGYSEYKDDNYLGGPVEAAWTADGKYLWVSNYSMVGEGFERPGCDACHGDEFDPGFLYKINASNFEIENVVKVGAVPKFLAISNDQKKLVVSNWSSGDVSIVNLETETLEKNVYVGPHPRGIDITEDSRKAYVTVMGSTKIAEVDLNNYDVEYIRDIGRSPRSLILADHDSTLFISMNSGRKVVKYNRYTQDKTYCKTAGGPRSMCMSPQEDYLYVVNYFDNSFSKIDCETMELAEQVKTSDKPIGICGNWDDSEIWVACYSGRIEIFKDFHLDSLHNGTSLLGFDLSSFWEFSSPKRAGSSEEKDKVDEEIVEVREEYDTSQEMATRDTFKDDVSTALNVPDEEIEVVEVVAKRSYPKRPELVIKNLKNPLKDEVEPQPEVRDHISNSNDCTYHVIAGSFSIADNAQSRRSELEGKGFPAQVINGSLNYVSAQCFVSRDAANSAMKDISSSTGYSCWVLKR